MPGARPVDTRNQLLPVVGSVAAGAYVWGLMLAMNATTYDMWGGLLLFPVLLAVSLPVLKGIARRDAQIGFGLLATALVCKLLASLVRYWQSYVLYSAADPERYHDAGVRISQALHQGLPWQAEGPFPGTAFVEGLTGYVYWAIGPSRIAGFLFFSWLGFWGLLLFQRAFRIALPGADQVRYARLVLFLPSLLFWPSSIGKEAWMTLFLGLGTYGAARLLARRPGSIVILALGIGGVSLVRPHMAVLVIGGLMVGYVVRPYSRRTTYGPLLKGVGIVVLLATAAVLVAKAEQFFGVSSSSSSSSVTQVLEHTSAKTGQGGSSFEATPVTSPLDLPMATVSVLLRPFPWEANNLQALAVSAESVFLIWLAWKHRGPLRRLPLLVRKEPFIGYALTYVLLFVTAFSSFANFGILTRQRVQVFPLVLVLLALPMASRAQQAPQPTSAPGVPPRRPLARAGTRH